MEDPRGKGEKEKMEHAPNVIPITDQQSLIHLGSLDSFDITEGGIEAARNILDYLKPGKEKNLKRAIDIYENLIPNENFGGEYTALEWLCRYFIAPEEAKKGLLAQPEPRSFYDLLCRNDYDNLIYYLNNKYHIEDDKSRDIHDVKTRMRFLEDFILFINPDRERWETTRENLKRCDLQPGMYVADVGSGPGYYTYKFSDIVGDEGKVYAIETNPAHLSFLRDYVEKNQVKNIEVVESTFEGIGLPPEVRVDVVFICSLYHNVYAAFTDEERDSFVASIRRALRDGGRLIIVDNDLVEGQELPYHGPYCSKHFIISQLWYYGFDLKDTFQFAPQRYVLIFDKTEPRPALKEEEGESVLKTADKEGEKTVPALLVRSSASLVSFRIIGTSTSGYTRRGKLSGRKLYNGLVEGNADLIREASKGFEELWPKERIGDDYTAFIWFAEYALADEARRKEMTADPMTAFYADYFCGNDMERLKTYLFYKFHLEKPDDPDASDYSNFEYDGEDFPISKLNQWNEFLVFNNPNRYLWEKTPEMCRFFDVKPGEYIADLGCGGGFFSWYFSKTVGGTGRVYSTEINKDALYYLDEFIKAKGIKNIETVVTRMNDAGLPENSVDTIFMCSMYHAVYITDIEFVKDAFLDSIHKALRPGGRLIIVDNAVSREGETPYYGSMIAPELVIGQLQYYGFRLKNRFQLIPQRYALIFEEVEGYEAPPRGGKDETGRDRMGSMARGHKGEKPKDPWSVPGQS